MGRTSERATPVEGIAERLETVYAIVSCAPVATDAVADPVTAKSMLGLVPVSTVVMVSLVFPCFALIE